MTTEEKVNLFEQFLDSLDKKYSDLKEEKESVRGFVTTYTADNRFYWQCDADMPEEIKNEIDKKYKELGL